LIDMIKKACEQSADFHESLDPFAPAAFNVSWAGEQTSLNWFDTARELTERWHHQQQIRLATSRPEIMTPELYHPVLDCFVRGLPHAYRDVNAPAGTVSRLEISGERGANGFSRGNRPDGSCAVKPIERSGRVASDDTAATGVARFHQGH
jgi:hypothetical protein